MYTFLPRPITSLLSGRRLSVLSSRNQMPAIDISEDRDFHGQARERRHLRARWTIEAAHDLLAVQGLHANVYILLDEMFVGTSGHSSRIVDRHLSTIRDRRRSDIST